MKPSKIVSGGQSGADRTALDVAIMLDLEHGGWCPKNRWAEDGRVEDKYKLTETVESNISVRIDFCTQTAFSRNRWHRTDH